MWSLRWINKTLRKICLYTDLEVPCFSGRKQKTGMNKRGNGRKTARTRVSTEGCDRSRTAYLLHSLPHLHRQPCGGEMEQSGHIVFFHIFVFCFSSTETLGKILPLQRHLQNDRSKMMFFYYFSNYQTVKMLYPLYFSFYFLYFLLMKSGVDMTNHTCTGRELEFLV